MVTEGWPCSGDSGGGVVADGNCEGSGLLGWTTGNLLRRLLLPRKHSKATVPRSGGRATVARGGDGVLLHAARRGRWGGGGERELSYLGGVGGMTWYS